MKARTLLITALLTLGVAANAGATDRHRDRDNNPPGPVGGPGTNWENPPGWKGSGHRRPSARRSCRCPPQRR